MAAITLPLRRAVGARQIALAVIILGLAALLAWYLIAIWYDLAPWLRGWKKYPDGWSWRFLETVPRLDRFITAGLGVTVIVAALLWLLRGSRGNSSWHTALGLAVLVIGVHVLEVGTLALKLSSPHALLVNRVLNEDFTGYFQAAQSVESPAEFFTDWRRLMKACGHCTSHPTGASAIYWPVIAAAEALPPETAQSVSSWLDETLRLRIRNVPPASVIAATALGHLNLFFAAVGVVPYFFLGRIISGSVLGGVLAAGLVATMPGLILMSPELDQIYVLISGAAMLALLLSMRAERWSMQAAMGLTCGLLLALGLFLTWGLLVWIPMLACLSIASLLGLQVYDNPHTVSPTRRIFRTAIAWGAAIVGLVGPYWLLGSFTPYDVRDVARQGLNHYQTFEAIGRPGGDIWLFYGPLDTTQFIGLPLTIACLTVMFASAGKTWLPAPAAWTQRLSGINVYAVALVGIIVVTFLGDYMKAESGRQLLFIMPLAAVALAASVRATGSQLRPSHCAVITAQTLVTVIIGARWITP